MLALWSNLNEKSALGGFSGGVNMVAITYALQNELIGYFLFAMSS